MLPSAVLCTFLLGAAVAGPAAHHVEGQPPRKPGAPFKLCVPEKAYKPCLKMLEQGKSLGIHMTCVVARDRVDCVEKIENHSADWGAVDPQDMYIAARHDNKYFSVFKEIRTKEEPKNEFRYEAVAVIHKDLEIKDLHQLHGLRSCHTGVGRNVGYKIPITKLTKMGILPPLNNTNISPRENELHALSSFFSKACLVGKWSPDPETNGRWKSQYSNLCQLCEFPEKCDYPDQNSGYEGALRCLTKASGQVAWTKVIYVKKFFGMAYGTNPAKEIEGVNKEDYAYLCPDASKKPITGPPCTWAARPWEGYMANTEITDVPSELKELRDEILKLNNLGEKEHADWISSVLALNNKTLAVDNDGPYSPQQYLDKAHYTDVIERDVIKPTRKVRFCVTSQIEKDKCEHLQIAAYSRDIRPQFECVQKSSRDECLIAVKSKEADIVSIDAGFLHEAESKNLQPVTTEIYDKHTSQHVIALVKAASSVKSLGELKGKKACLGEVGSAAGWITPIYALKKANAIKKHCPHQAALSEFFSSYDQSSDPIKCLVTGKGDVAFVSSDELEWVKNNIEEFKANEYKLLRLDGGLCDSDKADQCHLLSVPARMIVAHKQLSTVAHDDIVSSVLSAGELFHEDDYIFLMFGDYNGEQNVLFSNYATGFQTAHKNNEVSSSIEEFKKIATEVNSCS